MAEIARIRHWDGGDALLIPGTDPAHIHATALEELDDEEELLTPLDDVRVEWWRTSPCYPGRNCHEEGPRHRIHYVPTSGPTRGGFQAAELVIGQKEDQ